MNRKIMTLAAGFAMLAAQSTNPHFSPTPVNNKPTPDWKRKKCKSCKKFVNRSWSCSSNPNKQACEQYQKK